MKPLVNIWIQLLSICMMLILGTAGLFAQSEDPAALLVYYEDPAEIEVRSREDSPIALSTGMELRAGDTVRTGATVAELQLEPNGTIIKLARETTFTVEQLQRSQDTANEFSLVKGKLRAIAARSGVGAKYRVSTPSAVCGVRGTDFGLISLPGEEETAFVAQGTVEYRKLATNESLTLTSGMKANALAETFEAIRMSREQLNDILRDVQFEKLAPKNVPGHSPAEPEADEEKSAEEDEEEEQKDQADQEEARIGEKGTGDEGSGLTPGLAMTAGEARAADAGGAAGEGALSRYLGNYLGFEIGTVTMEGETYSKAVIKPHYEGEKLRFALFLPIIYTDDLLDRNEWYEPEGNDEWSFGSDEDWDDAPQKASRDLLRDLALKLHYLEWGDRRDPFFLKLGNLDNMSLGHGSIMKNYANDADFPAVRLLGLNLGIRGARGGFETVLNDVADPEIFGGRLFVTPIGALTFGASAVTDIDPLSAADQTAMELEAIDRMSFNSFGLDVELPIVEGDLLSIVPYADAAVFVPERDGEFYHDTVYTSSDEFEPESFHNYGLSAGFLGNITAVEYSLEYRYSEGLFHHSFFGPSYERIRGMRAAEVNAYLDAHETDSKNPYNEVTMGIYGDAAAELFDAVAFSAGYMWPWKKIDDDYPDNFGDEFSMAVRLLPDVIPVVGVHGSISYSRTNFAPMFTDKDLYFFDAYANFRGEIVFPLAPTVDLAGIFSTAVLHDEEGNIVYRNGRPKMVPNITIETRVSF